MAKSITFNVPAEIKEIARHYCKQTRTDLSKWVLSLVEAYLKEKKVLDKYGKLQNSWGDPSCMGTKYYATIECLELAMIGVAIDSDSDLAIGLRHYATGNSPDAPNQSALLRWLVERELRLSEVITSRGTLTAEWTRRLSAQTQAA